MSEYAGIPVKHRLYALVLGTRTPLAVTAAEIPFTAAINARANREWQPRPLWAAAAQRQSLLAIFLGQEIECYRYVNCFFRGSSVNPVSLSAFMSCISRASREIPDVQAPTVSPFFSFKNKDIR